MRALATCLLAVTPAGLAFAQPEPAAQPADPAPIESHFANHDGRKVHYVDSGGDATEAIVLVHGLASDHTMHEAQLQGLRHRARVLAIDLPGYGKSDMPKSEFSMDLFAEGITAVLDDAGVERAVLVGHSNGVPISRHFYRTQPDRTLALVSLGRGNAGNLFRGTDRGLCDGVLSSENYEQAIKAKVAPVFADLIPDRRAEGSRPRGHCWERQRKLSLAHSRPGSDPTNGRRVRSWSPRLSSTRRGRRGRASISRASMHSAPRSRSNTGKR